MWNKKEMSQKDATLTRGPWPLTLTFDLENSRSNCISGMGGSIVMERKRQESLGCPVVKHNHYVTPRQRILLPTGWLKMSAFPSTRLVGSDNGLSPGRRQSIIWTNDRMLLIGPLGTNFSEVLIKIYTFSFKKTLLKMLYGKWRPYFLGLNVLAELAHCGVPVVIYAI